MKNLNEKSNNQNSSPMSGTRHFSMLMMTALFLLFTALLFNPKRVGGQVPVPIDPKLTADMSGSKEGSSVSISADGMTAIVGAPNEGGPTGTGNARIYHYDGTSWSPVVPDLITIAQAHLSLQIQPGATFGYSVAISGDGLTAIVGAPEIPITPCNCPDGNVYVFIYNSTLMTWEYQTELLTPTNLHTRGSELGYSVSLSYFGDTALVGANNPDYNVFPFESSINAFIYTRPHTIHNTGIWDQNIDQHGPILLKCGYDPSTYTTLYPGSFVSLSCDGKTAVIGAPGDNNGFGVTKVFSLTSFTYNSIDGIYEPTSSNSLPTTTDNMGNSEEGYSVAISPDGNTIVEGGPEDAGGVGAIWVFQRNLSTGLFDLSGTKLLGSGYNGFSKQGTSVAISGDPNHIAIIEGGPNDLAPDGINLAGAVWEFTPFQTHISFFHNSIPYTFPINIWLQGGSQIGSKLVNTTTANGGGNASQQGTSVAISQDHTTFIEGGPQDNSVAGAAFVWSNSLGNVTLNGIQLCNGFPTAGTILQTPDCADGTITLSLSGESTDNGIYLQWQSSTDNINWNDITGATGSSYTTPPVTSTTYYQCEVFCHYSQDINGDDIYSTANATVNTPTPAICQNGGTPNVNCGCDCPLGFSGPLCQTATPTLWGLTSSGGAYGYGVLFQYDQATGIYTDKIDFTGTSGANPGSTPYGSLFQASDGNLYGMTEAGGTNNLGVIFRYNSSTNTYTDIVDFTGNSGAHPGANPAGANSLVEPSDGNLYGVTLNGGTNGLGVIFRYIISTNTYSDIVDFTGNSGLYPGVNPIGTLIKAYDGNLYGMTRGNDLDNSGAIFQYNISTNAYQKKIDFTGTSGSNPGANPLGSLLRATDEYLYGMTQQGGANEAGVIFRYNWLDNSYSDLHDLVDHPDGSLIQASDGYLYGMTASGGGDAGVIFQLNTTTSIPTYTITHPFDNAVINGVPDGWVPNGSLMQASDGNLYGMTNIGGSSNQGVIFQCTTSSNSHYSEKVSFTGNSGTFLGANPLHGNLIQITRCAASDIPIVTAYHPTINCGDYDAVSITSGNLNGADHWQWYASGCGEENGGTPVGTGLFIGVYPTSTTNYYVRGEGGCVTPPTNCGSAIVTVINTPTCQNGGTVNANCGCNCQPGYSGPLCQYFTPHFIPFPITSGPLGALVTLIGSHLDNLTNYSIGSDSSSAVLVSNTDTKVEMFVKYGAATGPISLSTIGGTATSYTDFTVTPPSPPNTQYGNKLTADDHAGTSNQGYSVAMDANGITAIVGGPGDSTVGAAWIYKKVNDVWTQQGNKLIGSAASTFSSFTDGKQGKSVSISADGTTAIVGSTAGNVSTGAAWIWKLQNNGSWEENKRLVANVSIGSIYPLDTNYAIEQGWSVSLSSDGNTALVGTANLGVSSNLSMEGAIVYKLDSTGNWGQQATLIDTAVTNYAAVQPGAFASISGDGNTAVIGEPGSNNNIGGILIFTQTSGTWTQLQPTLAGTGYSGNTPLQGYSVAISTDGNTIVEGGYQDSGNIGAIWIFTRNSNTGLFEQQGSKLRGNDWVHGTGFPHQGTSVSISYDGNTVVEGGYADSFSVGAVWVFTRSGTTWSQQGHKLVGNGFVGSSIDQGYSVSISKDANTLIEGGWNDNSGIGAAWIFRNLCAVPPTPFITTNMDTAICQGSSVILDAGNYFATYLWNNGGTDETISVSATGMYSVTVSDSNGCTGTNSIHITVYQNPTPVIDTLGSVAFCQGGSVTLDAGSYSSYLWSDGNNTESDIISVSGTYTVTVTDMHSCMGTASQVVTTNPLPVPIITGESNTCQGNSVVLDAGNWSGYNWTTGDSTETTSVSSNSIVCVIVTDIHGCQGSSCQQVTINTNPTPNIDTTGSATFCQGGSIILDAGTYSSYLWSTGGINETIVASSAGTYTVTVTDGNGCTGTASQIVIVNPNPTPSIDSIGPITFCEGGSYTFDAGTYSSYLWSTGGTDETITASSAGDYSVTVTDVNGCTGIASQNVTVNPNPIPSISGTATFCSDDGETVLDAGSLYVSYLWEDGSTNEVVLTATPGTYSVTVTDINGCTGMTSTSVTINQSPNPSINPNGPTTFNQGGNVILDAGNYTFYNWSTNETNETIDVTTTGIYMVTVTDINGCTGVASIDVTVIPITNICSITPNGFTTFCEGGSVGLDAGTGVSYLWSNGDTDEIISATDMASYCVTITYADSSGCSACIDITVYSNPSPIITPSGATAFCEGGSVMLDAGLNYSYIWSTGETDETITVSSSGTYTVYASNINGCVGVASQNVTVNPNPIPAIDTLGSVTFCQGGSVTLDAGNYSIYNWSNGATSEVITVSISNNYLVTVTDANGCVGITSQSVTVYPLSNPTISPSGPIAFCDGGSVSLDAGLYTSYSWNIGSTNEFITAYGSQPYCVTVTDVNGCTGTACLNVTVYSNPTPSITPNGPTTFCQGGSVSLDAGNNSSFSWSTGETTESISDTISGDFSVTVTNSNGCTGIASQAVTVNPNTTSTSISTSSSASNSTSTSSEIETACSSYTYNSQTYSTSGNYNSTQITTQTSVQVTQQITTQTTLEGCTNTNTNTNTNANTNTNTNTNTLHLTITPQITGLSITGPTSVCTGTNVSLSTNTTYGTYLWTNGATTQSIPVTATGIYYVTVSNGGNCTAVAHHSVTFQINPAPVIVPTNLINICGGGNATLTVSSIYPTYNWSTGVVSQAITINSGGTYTVTVSSTAGCTGTTSITASSGCVIPTNLATINIAATGGMANWVEPSCYYGFILRISKHNAGVWTNHTITPNTHYMFSGLTHNTQYDWQIETICNANAFINSGWSASQTFTTLARLADGETENPEYAFKVYPNPTNDKVTISFTSGTEDNYTIRLIDVTGRLIESINYSSIIGENQYQMDLSSVAKGIYMVILQNKDAVFQSKIVVE